MAGDGMSDVLRWRPRNKSGGPDASLNQSRPAFIGLGHELEIRPEKGYTEEKYKQ